MSPRFLVVVAAVAASGCAAETSEEEEGSENAIVGGVETKTEHPSVGYLRQPNGPRHCTGTLIKPDVVITAAHCYSGPGELHFGIGAFDKAKKTYAAAPSGDAMYPYAFVHPRFGQDGDGSHDLAYVVLKEAVPASVATPARISDHRRVDRCAFEAVGYGRSVAGSNAVTTGFFDLRKKATVCVTGNNAIPGLLDAKGVDGTTCVGDSGGGLMLDEGKDTIVAVVRGGDRCEVGSPIRFTALASHTEFVARALAASRVGK